MERIRLRWHVFRHVTVVFVTVSFSGCSIFAPSIQTIQVSSSPDGATVVAGGQPVGETPVQFGAYRGKDLLIEVHAQAGTKHVQTDVEQHMKFTNEFLGG